MNNTEKIDYLNSEKIDYLNSEKIDYHILDPYKDLLPILIDLTDKYPLNQICITSPSLKGSKKSPIKIIESQLIYQDIPILVINSIPEPKRYKHKLLITDFEHTIQSKVLVILDFNTSPFHTIQENEFKRIITLSTHHLVLIHYNTQNPLEITTKMIQQNLLNPIIHSALQLPNKPFEKRNKLSWSVMNLVNIASDKIMNQINQISWSNLSKKQKKIEITNFVNGINVSDINGTAIPCYYELKKTGKSTVLKGLSNENFCISRLLKLSLKKISDECGDKGRYEDIHDFTWLRKKILNQCTWRIDQMIGTCEQNFEVKTSRKIGEYKIKGFMDTLTEDGRVFEFKCVNEIENKHKLQLILYAWTRNFSDEYYLLNILDGNILKLEKNEQTINTIVQNLIQELTLENP